MCMGQSRRHEFLFDKKRRIFLGQFCRHQSLVEITYSANIRGRRTDEFQILQQTAHDYRGGQGSFFISRLALQTIDRLRWNIFSLLSCPNDELFGTQYEARFFLPTT